MSELVNHTSTRMKHSSGITQRTQRGTLLPPLGDQSYLTPCLSTTYTLSPLTTTRGALWLYNISKRLPTWTKNSPWRTMTEPSQAPRLAKRPVSVTMELRQLTLLQEGSPRTLCTGTPSCDFAESSTVNSVSSPSQHQLPWGMRRTNLLQRGPYIKGVFSSNLDGREWPSWRGREGEAGQ
jgi:hypothetical protein